MELLEKIDQLELEISNLNDKSNKKFDNLLNDISHKSQIMESQTQKIKELEQENKSLKSESLQLSI